MDWFIENNDVSIDNPFKGASVKSSKKNQIKRRPFTDHEVTKLLDYNYTHFNECINYRYEATIYLKVGIFTGMRLDEPAQLLTERVKDIDGVLVFDLRGAKVKTNSSGRTIPVCDGLMNQGFAEYLDKCRSSGQKYLFPKIR